MEKNFFKTVLVDALLHSILEVLIFVFLTPYRLWVKACEKLAEQKKNKTLDLSGINSQWPFLTFLKRFNFDFYFDACIVLSFPIGILLGLYEFINMLSSKYIEFIGVGPAFLTFFGILLTFYYLPIMVAITRDICMIILIPFRKFLNWGSKPAQYMDLNITKDSKEETK